MKRDYEYIKNIIITFGQIHTIESHDINPIRSLSIMNFSIDTELDKLIPDELGTMKDFFIKILTRYFNTIHPII